MSECSSRIREGSINFGLYTLRSNSWLSPSKMLSFLLTFDPFNIKISFVSFQSTWRNESRFHLTEGCWRSFWCRHTFILILFLWTMASAAKQKTFISLDHSETLSVPLFAVPLTHTLFSILNNFAGCRFYHCLEQPNLFQELLIDSLSPPVPFSDALTHGIDSQVHRNFGESSPY